MGKRGPRSSASNLVVLDATRSRPKLTPPQLLTKIERALFIDATSSNPHLKPGDAQFLASYCMALAKSNKLARKTDTASIKSWELTTRVMISMATKLRITSQATTHPEKAGRARANQLPPSYYETMDDFDDDND